MASSPQTILITGAAQRIGAAMALHLGRHGWSVALHYRSSTQGAEATAAEIEQAGGKAALVQADLSDEASVQTLVERSSAALGSPLSALINNASAFQYDSIESMDRASWDAHMEPNLRAPLVLSQALAAQMPAGGGAIINMIDQGHVLVDGTCAFKWPATENERQSAARASAAPPRTGWTKPMVRRKGCGALLIWPPRARTGRPLSKATPFI